ncbi:MAG: polyphosphate kinase 2 family protein [Dehalococcoidia bacterium]|nr:polyphosphate kinase 2 family protein [Dehalococcoidia bacterium]
MSNNNHGKNGDQPVIPPFDRDFAIEKYNPAHTGGMSKEQALEEIVPLRTRLNDLQNVLYADRRFSILVILQGIDTAGKDGTINSVFQVVGPLGCHVANFGVPNEEELAHDYMWRYHKQCPERGKIAIFNRSYYEAVLVERVKEIVPPSTWRERYDEINAFERYLDDQHTVVMKFFLHISKDEQRERLQERVDNPRKQWKFRSGDIDERRNWDTYQSAFEDMVRKCNTRHAPWHVVPADRKWYRDVVVARALVERLEQLDLKYPQTAEGVAGLKVV